LKSKSFAHSARASGEQKSGYTEGPGQQNPWKSSPAAGEKKQQLPRIAAPSRPGPDGFWTTNFFSLKRLATLVDGMLSLHRVDDWINWISHQKVGNRYESLRASAASSNRKPALSSSS